MPTFKYIARSQTGEKVEGSVEAQDKRAALLQIERLGQVPVSVFEGGLGAPASATAAGDKKGFTLEWKGSGKARMGMREVLLFTRELSDLLASGMTLGNALHTLSRRKISKGQDKIVTELRDEIVQGASLSDALAQWPEHVLDALRQHGPRGRGQRPARPRCSSACAITTSACRRRAKRC